MLEFARFVNFSKRQILGVLGAYQKACDFEKEFNLSIYFIHFFVSFLPLVFGVSLASARFKGFKQLVSAVFVGFLFGYFAFFIAANSLRTNELNFYTNFLFIGSFVGLFVLGCLKNELLLVRLVCVSLASFAFAVRYLVLSQDFPIFTSTLLDSQAVISAAFILLALILCLIFFVFLRFAYAKSPKFSLFALLIVLICELNRALASILLVALRENFIKDSADGAILNFIAQSQSYADFARYLYLALALILGFLCLKGRGKVLEKRHLFDIEFRKSEAKNSQIRAYFASCFISVLIALGVILHFNLIASKPLQIDPATEVQPDSNGLFVFDIELLRDNGLHRFAYVTSEGKVVRFFLLNKREDRDSPVAVFDACMICGDMGYVKRGGELICVACNVRIFLLSVGKEGGCNPIPLKYAFDGEKITIKLEDVIYGTNFFTEIKEVMVSDPVSKARFLNSKAEFSYLYKGFTYYFATKESYNAFVSEPERYVDGNLSAKFRAQGYGEGF